MAPVTLHDKNISHDEKCSAIKAAFDEFNARFTVPRSSIRQYSQSYARQRPSLIGQLWSFQSSIVVKPSTEKIWNGTVEMAINLLDRWAAKVPLKSMPRRLPAMSRRWRMVDVAATALTICYKYETRDSELNFPKFREFFKKTIRLQGDDLIVLEQWLLATINWNMKGFIYLRELVDLSEFPKEDFEYTVNVISFVMMAARDNPYMLGVDYLSLAVASIDLGAMHLRITPKFWLSAAKLPILVDQKMKEKIWKHLTGVQLRSYVRVRCPDVFEKVLSQRVSR